MNIYSVLRKWKFNPTIMASKLNMTAREYRDMIDIKKHTPLFTEEQMKLLTQAFEEMIEDIKQVI